MNKIHESIPKQPALKPAEDYYGLRREGIGFVEKMGSQLWTDYNTHDPGITILEALCYAITDLAYRARWDIKDLLAPESSSIDPNQPFPNQAFFTARDILTVNPVTPDDFRRLLIDLPRIRNAWVFCKACACDFAYYAWCEQDQLMLSYQKPIQERLRPKRVEPLGLYEILLELENDPELGDLNDHKIDHAYAVLDSENKSHWVNLEMRFPDWGLLNSEQWQLFLDSKDAFFGINGESFNLNIRLGATKTYDVFTDPALNDEGRNQYLRDHWRNVLFISFKLELLPSGQIINIENGALRIFGDTVAKNQATAPSMKLLFEDKSPAGFIQRYRKKLLKTQSAIVEAKSVLYTHRNLDEDYCRIKVVEIEDVTVCADIEVSPDADIERIQARIWFEIEQYLNPPVPFYTLQELLDSDTPVEEIFNGPELRNGFIKTEELQAAGLKSVLRTSDIINRLIDIDGIVSVNNLLLSKYDAEGNVAKGVADPAWATNGSPIFDTNKVSASWLLFISSFHQPRLHRTLSRFLFFKNGLPFKPRMDEANNTLIQLRGEAERPKITNAQQDLPIPLGTFKHQQDYYPLQYSFPMTYGIGLEGLPSHVLPERRAQAKQLKAYLMVFEQLLGNALAQLAHTADLFSLDPAVKTTYFIREFSEAIIQGYDEIKLNLDKAGLEAMAETSFEFYERRNRFLNHLMARFGEQFGEYALLLTNFEGRQVALDRLIEDKISFLKAYPLISHDRGRAFNYKVNPCSPDNFPGIKKRFSLLLGYPDLVFLWTIAELTLGQFNVKFQLKNSFGILWFEGEISSLVAQPDTVTLKAFQDIILQMVQLDAYNIVPEFGPYRLKLKDKNGFILGRHPVKFASKAEAEVVRDELIAWSANERAIVVEHLLLRPKFLGDALYPACAEGACKTCGDEDPYSFRITFVMPGWTSPYNVNMDLRRFAERTLQQETPAYLLSKICWVGNDGFVENPCDSFISVLAELLETNGLTAGGVKPVEVDACTCATAIYKVFSGAFEDWYKDKTLDYIQVDALIATLKMEFNTKIDAAVIVCTTVLDTSLWLKIQEMMVKHFQQIALYGWQFERFENAWCKWLETNAKIDWTEEHLQENVLAILKANRQSGAEADLCHCATAILVQFGMDFYNWMESNLTAGRNLNDFDQFTPKLIVLNEGGTISPSMLCGNFIFKSGTALTLQTLLKERYSFYKEVSYRLRIVVNLLSKLRNTYPGATLHDCDDGSDQNPVRLDNTALGNYPLRSTTT